nr:hypothetical protein [Tanacetum cinerariifolium]
MSSTRAVSYAVLRVRNPAISTTGSVSRDAPSLYQNPSLKLPQAPHLYPPLSPSVKLLLDILPLLLVLPQDLPEGLLQASPQDLPKGLLQDPPQDLPEGLLLAPPQDLLEGLL